MRLILVRHGQSLSNVNHALDTQDPGADLTELGHQQAAAAATRLAAKGIGAIFASPLVRTQQTAAPLAERVDKVVAVRDQLREASAGELEMRSDDAAIRTYLKTYLAWINGELDARIPGGEDGHTVVDRVDRLVDEMNDQGLGTVVAFSHGATMRTWCAARATNLTADYIAMNPVHNCGAVTLLGTPTEGWRVEAWQDEAIGGLDVVQPQDPAAETPADLKVLRRATRGE